MKRFNLINLTTKKLKQKDILSICKLKNSYWPWTLSNQVKWFKSNVKKMGYEMKNYVSNILLEVALLSLVIFSIANNLSRFSNTKTMVSITNKQSVFLYGILSIFSILILLYCKQLTILNMSSIKTNLLPIFFVFIPFITALIVLYYNTDSFIRKNEIGYENVDQDSTFVVNTVNNNDYKFSPPPKGLLPKTGRIIIQVCILGLIIFNLTLFIRYFNKNDGRTILDKVISSNENARLANKVVFLFFIILIVSNISVIYQQYDYAPCKIGLPLSWNF